MLSPEAMTDEVVTEFEELALTGSARRKKLVGDRAVTLNAASVVKLKMLYLMFITFSFVNRNAFSDWAVKLREVFRQQRFVC